MSNSPQHVTIRLDVQVPVGVTATVHRDEPPAPPRRTGSIIPFSLTTSEPQVGESKKVKPNPATPGFGSICANATFSVNAVNVQAKVYSDFTGKIPLDPTNEGATPGQKTDQDGKAWTWDDQHGNALTGVKHAAAGATVVKNKLVIWYIDPLVGDSYEINCITFTGVTGTTGTCGTGPGSGPSFVSSTHSTFPAFWCVEVGGFGGDDAVFNSLHALHSRRADGATPTWDNHGDGLTALRLELSYSPSEHRWTLTCKRGAKGFTATAVSTSCFGPLDFTVGQAGGTAQGPHGTPRVRAHTV